MTSVSVARRRDHDDSEEYSDASQDIEHNNSGHDGGQHESDYDSQGSDSDRSDQDSENKETERRVDDDEDRSNPQYIPKRGTFYEHDDRTAASGEESSNTTSETASEKKEGSEAGTERRRPPRKSDIVNKWSHDKYNENEQAPKSRDELVAIYGYDIRNEDAPPHARRNRRYGRGPNKYTRTWEDEEAYRRQNAAQLTPRKPPNPEDFPEFDPNKRQGKRTPRPRSKSQPSVGDPVENGSLRRQASIKSTKKPTPRPVPRPTRPEQRTRDSMPLIENLTITASVNNNNNSPGQGQRKVNATVAQQRPVPTDLGKKKPMINAQPSPQPSPVPNKSLPSSPGPQPTLKPQQQAPQQNQQGQQQAASGGSKRYSSLRQRPLAEPYATQPQPQPQQTQQPPPQQPPHRYHAGPNEFAANVAPPHAHAPHLMHQVRSAAHTSSPPQHAPPAQPPLAQQINSSQVRLGILEQQQLAAVSHPHHTIHNMPQPHSIGQLQPSQAYAPPAMMPAQYMQQSGSGAVFGGAMFPAAPHAPHAPHATHAPHPTHASHATHASHGTHASHATHATHASHAPHPTHAPHATHATHAPYQHQMYPHHNYNACEQVRCNPMELAGNLKATQAGGVTYYNCAEQEVPPAPRTQRRPTAAIPIVSPHHSDRPANSTEKDNIDRIVENMFVRKPWPATHGADSKDKQLENRGSQEPPSKESSQPNSLTSSSISTDSKPSESREEKTEEVKEDEKKGKESEEKVVQESIVTDA